MKKIETLIRRSNLSVMIDNLKKLNCMIIDVQNLEYIEQPPNKRKNGKNIKNSSIPISKLELIVSEKYFKRICQEIVRCSGLSPDAQKRALFVTTVEIFDRQNAPQERKGLENVLFTSRDGKKQTIKKPISKRSRMVPLQNITVSRTSEIYEKYKEKLQSEYKIETFSGFVNYCIRYNIVTLEQQLKYHKNITINNQILK